MTATSGNYSKLRKYFSETNGLAATPGSKRKLASASLPIGPSHDRCLLVLLSKTEAVLVLRSRPRSFSSAAGNAPHRKIPSSLSSLTQYLRLLGKVIRSSQGWHRRRDLNPDGRFWRPQCCHYITPVYQTADSNRADGVHSAAPYHPIGLSGIDGPW